MDYDQILHYLLEKAIICFNSGDYGDLDELIVDNVRFTAPAYDNQILNEPDVEFKNKQELFEYWRRMHSSYNFIIADVQFLQVGKISKFRNTMRGIGYIVDAEVHFDEMGKVTKLYNTIKGTI